MHGWWNFEADKWAEFQLMDDWAIKHCFLLKSITTIHHSPQKHQLKSLIIYTSRFIMMEEYNKSAMPSNFLVMHCHVPLPCFKLSSQIIILQRFAISSTFSNEKREKRFSLFGLPGACLQSSNSNNPPEETWAASGNKLSNILWY